MMGRGRAASTPPSRAAAAAALGGAAGALGKCSSAQPAGAAASASSTQSSRASRAAVGASHGPSRKPTVTPSALAVAAHAVARARSRSGNQTTATRETGPIQNGPAAALSSWPACSHSPEAQRARAAGASASVGTRRSAAPASTSSAPATTFRRRPSRCSSSHSCTGKNAMPATGPQLSSMSIAACPPTAAP